MTEDPHPSTFLSNIETLNDFAGTKKVMGLDPATVIEDDAGIFWL
jgi:hypothetical protein